MPVRLPSHSSIFNVTLIFLFLCLFFVVSLSSHFLALRKTIFNLIDCLGVLADWDHLVKQSPKDTETSLFISSMWRIHLIDTHMLNSTNQTQLWDSKNILQLCTCQRPKNNQFVVLFTDPKNWFNVGDTEMVWNVDAIYLSKISAVSFCWIFLCFNNTFSRHKPNTHLECNNILFQTRLALLTLYYLHDAQTVGWVKMKTMSFLKV